MLGLSSARVTGLLLTAGILSGCTTAPPPLAPTAFRTAASPVTPNAATTMLTVRVLTRGSEQPIANAIVLQNDSFVAATDRDGLARTQVPVGVEFYIDVKATGYVGFGAAATVAAGKSEERWTFYLERDH